MNTQPSPLMILLLLATVQAGSCFYNPQPGRWLSRDPIGEESFFNSHAEGLVRFEQLRAREESLKPLYAFLLNDSVNHNDAHGLWGESLPLPVYIALHCRRCFHPLDGRDTDAAHAAGYQMANDSYPFDSLEHVAMRHCVASGLLATRVGCSTAECYGTQRELWQNANENQPKREGDRGINNNRLGRQCAGCLNSNGTADPGGQRANPPPRTSLEAIADCCRNAIDTGQADTGTGPAPPPVRD
jgi:hypothetical protein